MKTPIPGIETKYEILDQLGAGGMGAVFRARHRQLDHIRVIKVMRPGYEQDETFRKRFSHEARLAVDLEHPHIARLYDFDQAPDGTAYIVMEYVEGETLEKLLSREGPLSIELLLRVAKQILSALDYLHRRRIIHRDLSPDNMLLTRDLEGHPLAKLIDLGIAKAQDSRLETLTQHGYFTGKLSYAPPEVMDGHASQADERGDLYSLGVVLYQLATGNLPFVIEGLRGFAAKLTQPPRSFDETDPTGRVPRPLRRMILKALSRHPADRYPTAAAFLQDLESLGWTGATAQEEEPTIRLPVPGASGSAPTAHIEVAAVPSPPALALDPTKLIRTGALPRRALQVALVLALVVTVVVAIRQPWRELREPERAIAHATPYLGPFYALLIGNDHYARLPRLESAVRDATALATLLAEDYGFETQLLTDASWVETKQALLGLSDRLDERSSLLIYYAGHGYHDTGHGITWWQPVDAELDDTTQWIEAREVLDAISKVRARRVLLIADSCYAAGIALDGHPVAADGNPPPVPSADLRARMVLTSGGISPVLDGGGSGHSVFSGALLNLLHEEKPVWTATELYAGLSRVAGSRPLADAETPRLYLLEHDALAGAAAPDFYFQRLAADHP